MKRCGRCLESKPLEAFARRRRGIVRRQSVCRNCQHDYYTAYYRDRTELFARKTRERTMRQRAVNRFVVTEYLASHPCIDCGIADPVVLEFDHVGAAKSACVSELIHAPASLETLAAEIAKCVVRCANCHRRKTSELWRQTGYGTRRRQDFVHDAAQ